MRLIDEDALTKRFVEFCNKNCPYTAKERNVMCGSCFMGLALEAVEDAPTIEPQPKIIRCKECRHRIVNDHYGERGYLKIKGYCELDTGDPFELGRDAGNDDWFCADAERRTE